LSNENWVSNTDISSSDIHPSQPHAQAPFPPDVPEVRNEYDRNHGNSEQQANVQVLALRARGNAQNRKLSSLARFGDRSARKWMIPDRVSGGTALLLRFHS
jgi:hypothetical protein